MVKKNLAKKAAASSVDVVIEQTLVRERRVSNVSAGPLPKAWSRSELDIVKKNSSRRSRYMLVFNLQMEHLSAGRVVRAQCTESMRWWEGFEGNCTKRKGTLTQLDTQSPVLYIEFPQGRLKLFGTLCFPRAKYIVLRSLSKSLLCEDVLESMIVFQEAWWVGTVEENPGELRLEMPRDLAAPGEVPVPAADTLPEVQAPTPASVRATPKRRRDMEDDDSDSPLGGPSKRSVRRLSLDLADDMVAELPSQQSILSTRPVRAAAQRASQQLADDGASGSEEESDASEEASEDASSDASED